MIAQYCILNHHSRDPEPLVSDLRRIGIDPIVYDPTDYYRQKRGSRYKGVVDNYIRILSDEWPSDRKVILHDDLELSDHFRESVEYILSDAPNAVISFFNSGSAVYRKASSEGRKVVAQHANWWVPCLAWDKQSASDFVNWVRASVKNEGRYAEDGLMWRFYSLTGRRAYVVMPSIVQHRLDVKSTHGNLPRIGSFDRNAKDFNKANDLTGTAWEFYFNRPYLDHAKITDYKHLAL